MANNFLKGIGNFFGNLGTAALGGTPLLEGGKFKPKKFFTENGFGQILSAFGIGDMYSQEQMNIDAENRQEQNQIESEQRANAEYDRRMADERAYNDPAAQAERMRGAGLNPMASVGGISSSTTDAAAPQQSTAPMSSPRGSNTGGIGAMLELASFGEGLKSRKLENEMLEEQIKNEKIAQILGMDEHALKRQLFDYNEKANPYLLEGLEQRNAQNEQDLKNSVQEYENLVKEGKATDQQIEESKQRIEESKQRVIQSKAEVLLVEAKRKNAISEASYRDALTATEKWNTLKAEEDYNIAKVDFDSKESIYDALYESGAYKEMTESQRKQAKALADIAQAQFTQFSSIWNTTDSSFVGQMFRFLLYLCTNIA